MKKIFNFRKSISWAYFLLLFASAAGWAALPSSHDWGLFATGAAAGLVMEGLSSFFRSRANKLANLIEVLALLACTVLVFLSPNNLVLLSLDFGAVLVIFILQIGNQIAMKRMVTWEDIRENKG